MHKLSSKTSNLISSAQVATSVSNVVKELIENALDADSTSIQIKLDEFGMKKIDVKDNGNGIKADYVQFFGQRHYTSKLKEEKDLLTLLTYGFRGEALSSICEVADVSVITKTCNDPHSTAYTLNSHGAVTAMRPSHLGQGTTVLVSNLFKNLPVRKNYFAAAKKRKEQLKHTEELLMAFALANPLTHFSLSNNKSLLWQKPKSKSLNEAVANVFDATTIQNMEEKSIKSPDQRISIHAFVPKKFILRRTNDRCFVLINKRPVRDKQIDKSIRTILCKGESEKENQSTGWPAIVLSITLPTETVDVNVNPNKTQVFLSVKDKVLQLLESLLNASVNPGTSLHNTTENHLSLKSQYSLFDADTYNSQVNRLQSTLNDADLPSFPDFLEVNASKPTFTNCSVLMSDTTIDSSSCLGLDFSTSSDSTSRLQESTDNQGAIVQNGYSAQENTDQNRKIMKSAVHNDPKSLKCLNTVVSPSSCNSNLTECRSDHNLNLETNRNSDKVFHLSTSEDERVQSKCIQDITQQNSSTILKKANAKQTHEPVLDHGDAWSRGMAATDSLGNYLQPVTVCTGIKRNARTSCSPSTEATHAKKPRTVFDVLNESARGLNWDCASANLKKNCLSVASKEYDDHRKAIKKANTMNSSKQGRKIRNSFINLNQKRNKDMQLEEEDVVETPEEFPIKFGMNCLKNSGLNLPLSSYINVIGFISGHYAAVASLSKTLYWVNLHRLYEQSTYEKLIKNHIFESVQCEAIEMTMVKFEGAEFSLLGRFQTSVNLCGKEEILDERLASNGYKVEKIKTETSETFNLVGVPDCLLNHSPLQNISEILKEIYKDACVPIGRCRPLNAINYLQGESAREAKSAPLMTNRKEVEDCINSLKIASSPLVQEKCFHNKPILIKLANIGWSG